MPSTRPSAAFSGSPTRDLTETLVHPVERMARAVGAEALRQRVGILDHQEVARIAAGERYCAPASPDLFHLLTVQLGWTTDEHCAWLVSLLQADLLGRVRRRGSGSASARTHPC